MCSVRAQLIGRRTCILSSLMGCLKGGRSGTSWTGPSPSSDWCQQGPHVGSSSRSQNPICPGREQQVLRAGAYSAADHLRVGHRHGTSRRGWGRDCRLGEQQSWALCRCVKRTGMTRLTWGSVTVHPPKSSTAMACTAHGMRDPSSVQYVPNGPPRERTPLCISLQPSSQSRDEHGVNHLDQGAAALDVGLQHLRFAIGTKRGEGAVRAAGIGWQAQHCQQPAHFGCVLNRAHSPCCIVMRRRAPWHGRRRRAGCKLPWA